MSRDRKLMIIAGSALMALMIAIAAFSLGVYVGIHGWFAGPPAVSGPGPRQPPTAGQGAPATLPGRAQPSPHPQLVGVVRSVAGQTITLDTQQGPRLFQVETEVQVLRVDRSGQVPASVAEIVPGVRLAVFGRFEGDGARQLIAERLVLLPPPPR